MSALDSVQDPEESELSDGHDSHQTSGFHAIAKYHQELAVRDREDDEDGPIRAVDSNAIRYTLKTLFDPDKTVLDGWHNVQRMGFEEELEVYILWHWVDFLY